ncbi:hypothetical protein EUAN_23800 [Andreesenia angusta]|uniref:Uncharacterized protein n=1 Tax=Andreesenia angusta TaxID=39480 RepID=A0A1S1V3H6_9FIRM|nr:hypothetical protein [Andreesenia angusta]OHW61256.1 hypothetical protein EUAN_23800 [Andreesenia angusta]
MGEIKEVDGWEFEIRENGLFDLEKGEVLKGSEQFSKEDLVALIDRTNENSKYLEETEYMEPPLYSFDYEDEFMVGNPFYEESERFRVNPFEYYGVENIRILINSERMES